MEHIIKRIYDNLPLSLRIRYMRASAFFRYHRFPMIENIELTNACPMKCIMCPRTYSMTRKIGFMEFDLFQKINDEIAKYNVQKIPIWLHHFGESLLHPKFDQFIEYAYSKGIKTRISLNPFLLTKTNRQKLLNSNVSELVFSLDGIDENTFSKIRGIKNSYKKVKKI